jgi:Cellulase (glycosyl hydrolase family 5)
MKTFIERWRVPSFRVGFVLFSALAVHAQQAAYVPRIHPSDPHRFAVNGSTWYLAGYTPALSVLIDQGNPSVSRYQSMMDKMAAYGINSFRNWFTAGQPYANTTVPYERTGPGLAADGRPRFDLNRFNQAHFDYFRQVVEYARARGIVVQLSIFDFWHGSAWIATGNGNPQQEFGLKHDFYVRGNNINGLDVTSDVEWFNTSHPVFQYQKALVAKVIDTLGDQPNIIWEVCNEAYPEVRGYPWQIALANYITSYEQSKGLTPHLVMPRDTPNHENSPGYMLHPDVRTIRSEMFAARNLNQPLIAHNDSSFDVATPDYRRKEAWAVLTAGGHLDFFHFGMLWQSELDSSDVSEGMRYIGYTNKFLNDLNVNLVGMVPADHLVTNGWCYARSGGEYVIYLISGGSTTVSNLPSQFTATWFNPRTGTQQAAIGGPTFTAPDGSDWVLHIGAGSSQPGPGGGQPGTGGLPGTFVVTATPAVVSPGGVVTVTWSGFSTPRLKDWVGRYYVEAGDGAYQDWKYTSSCGYRVGIAPVSAGSCTFVMPSSPGTYQFRLFPDDKYTRLAVSSTVTVR